jgi:hypothetical protein
MLFNHFRIEAAYKIIVNESRDYHRWADVPVNRRLFVVGCTFQLDSVLNDIYLQ